MSIFQPRKNYKPFEYPQVLQFTEAMQKGFWVHSEVDFTADVQDFHSQLEPFEQNAVKNALLAIAQIEVSVKTFWGNLYNLFPKPELNGLGATFAECEFRHSEAYSRLLEVLGFNNEFEKVLEVPAIAKRIAQLNLARTDYPNLTEEQAKTVNLLMFAVLVENVSLFSQFASVLYLTRHKGLMKNIANIIAWTSVDEGLHGQAGLALINIIKDEHPEIFTEELKAEIANKIRESIEIEAEINAWIFEQGDFEKSTQADLLAYMKRRVNDSMEVIGFDKPFSADEIALAKNLKWFEEEVYANSLTDFFASRPVDYSKYDKSITANDLF
ncbi:ribonucleoside-diphosphate reductase subunit beta [Chryseobacterium phage MA9V-1]|nr:ribonucleoside-diphosphate reductase subunit beta [Chryseobacterium phage MA9V-1]